MPRGEGKDKCRCPDCTVMDSFPNLMNERFFDVMQSVWGPVEVEALVTTEESRASSSQAEQELSTAVTEWVCRISEKKNEKLRNYWVDNELPPDTM